MAQGKGKQEPVWTFRASARLIGRAEAAAKELGVSRSEFVRRAIEAEATRMDGEEAA